MTCSFCLNKSTTFFRAALHDPWSGDPRTITVSANHASAPAALEVSLVQKSLPSLHSVGERGSRTLIVDRTEVKFQSYDPIFVKIHSRVAAFLPRIDY